MSPCHRYRLLRPRPNPLRQGQPAAYADSRRLHFSGGSDPEPGSGQLLNRRYTMRSSSIRQSEHEQFRLWGTRDEPIASAVRALRGPGQQLRLRVNPNALEHQLVSVETTDGDLVGFVPRPDARRVANRLESGEFVRVTLLKASSARVRPVPVIEVQFAPDQSPWTKPEDQPVVGRASPAADNQFRTPGHSASSGHGCLIFLFASLPALLASGAIYLAHSFATRKHY